MIIGRCVRTPCPISGFFAMIVIAPSGVIVMKAFGWKFARRRLPPASAASFVSSSGMYAAISMPPPAMDETRRKLRRSSPFFAVGRIVVAMVRAP